MPLFIAWVAELSFASQRDAYTIISNAFLQISNLANDYVVDVVTSLLELVIALMRLRDAIA